MLHHLLESSTPATSLTAALVALKISKLLHRNRDEITGTMERLSALLDQTQFIRDGGFEIQVSHQEAQYWAFGELPQQDLDNFFASRTTARLSVKVWLVPREQIDSEILHLFSEYLAQQIALFCEIRELQRANAALSANNNTDRESLQLRKLLERAKTIIAAHNRLTREQAHEFLLSSSARSGKELAQTAQEIILVFGAPEKPRLRGRHRGDPFHETRTPVKRFRGRPLSFDDWQSSEKPPWQSREGRRPAHRLWNP